VKNDRNRCFQKPENKAMHMQYTSIYMYEGTYQQHSSSNCTEIRPYHLSSKLYVNANYDTIRMQMTISGYRSLNVPITCGTTISA
jgi:hypothetical protein